MMVCCAVGVDGCVRVCSFTPFGFLPKEYHDTSPTYPQPRAYIYNPYRCFFCATRGFHVWYSSPPAVTISGPTVSCAYLGVIRCSFWCVVHPVRALMPKAPFLVCMVCCTIHFADAQQPTQSSDMCSQNVTFFFFNHFFSKVSPHGHRTPSPSPMYQQKLPSSKR